MPNSSAFPGKPRTLSLGDRLALVASGLSKYERSKKAKQQPRDFNGRWVGAGANVRWTSHGIERLGTVKSIKDGRALVTVKNPDGSTSERTLDPSTFSVDRTKARLTSTTEKFHDEDNDLPMFMDKNKDKVNNAAEKDGAVITRKDRYGIEIKKSKSSPLVYQLYAPNSTSLGIFSEPSGIEDVISADKGEAAPVVASTLPKAFAVPKAVKELIMSRLPEDNPLSESDLRFLESLTDGSPISYEEIVYLRSLIGDVRRLYDLLGGDDTYEWVNRIEDPVEILPAHDFFSGQFEYYIAHFEFYDELIAVDFFASETEPQIFVWDNGAFIPTARSTQTYEAQYIEPIDEYTAQIASELPPSTRINPHDFYPEERNMFALASDYINTDHLKSISQLAYDSSERAYDASQQSRGEAGKFAVPSSQNGEFTYFAIMDDLDETAVIDVISITKDENGQPAVFKRFKGDWFPDPSILAKLNSGAPPVVIHLDDEKERDEVIAQVDDYDKDKDTVAPSPTFAIKKSLALFTATADDEYADEAIRLAQKFNRVDLIPESLRPYGASLSEDGIYGEYGEVLTASAQGANPLERLEDYLINNRGPVEIDWKSSTAVDYATKVFTKYMPADEAMAFAMILKNKATA